MGEYDLPKSDGDICFDGDFNILYGEMLYMSLLSIWSHEYAGTFKNRLNDVSEDRYLSYNINGTGLDSGGSGSNVFVNAQVGAFVANTYDDFGDASISAVNWTTAIDGIGEGSSISETAGVLRMVANHTSAGTAFAQATTNGSTGWDGNTADGTFMVDVEITDGSPAGLFKVQATDGSTTVDIISLGASSTSHTFYEVYFDSVANEAYIRYRTSTTSNWTNWGGAVDLSTLTTNYYVRFRVQTTTGSNSITADISHSWDVQGGAVSTNNDLLTTVDTPNKSEGTNPQTFDIGLAMARLELQGGSIVYAVSSNNGSDYYTQTSREPVSLTNTGYQVIGKYTMTTAADRPAFLYDWGVWVWE
jgi:hypothetical protein